jgi:Flp pilus assembly protein TadD
MYSHLATAGRCRPEGLLIVASRLGKVGAYEQAVTVYREALRHDPRAHEALFGMAFALRRLGQSLEAILPLVAQAHEFAPQVTTYRVLLASIYAELGQKDEAYDLLQNLAPAAVSCRCCLHRMLTVFRMMGDDPRCSECNDQMERLENRANLDDEG